MRETSVRGLGFAALLSLAACASPPKPVVPDGSTRVPVNDPGRIAQLQQLTGLESVAVAERSALMREVAALRQQVTEMREVMKLYMTTPELKGAAASPATPAAPAGSSGSLGPGPALAPHASDTGALPSSDFSLTSTGAVFRFYFEPGAVGFAPHDAKLHAALQAAAKAASRIVVWGHTDSAVVHRQGTFEARERAVNVRRWLIENEGVSAAVVRARFHPCCQLIGDNATPAGRALNRRVEIHVTGDTASAVSAMRS